MLSLTPDFSDILRRIDEEDANRVGVRISAQLFPRILDTSETRDLALPEPVRTQLIFAAVLFAASQISYHAGRFFQDEGRKSSFITGVQDNFALITDVASTPDDELSTQPAIKPEEAFRA